MRILLDTHTLIWHQADSDRLSAKAAKILDERTNILYISMATLWEMAIKRSQGKLSIERTPLELLKIYQRRGAKLLQISTVHVMAIVL